MNNDCYIVEDLLPLYNEGLLQEETTHWVESHIKSCKGCQELASLSQEPIDQEPIHSSIDTEKMLRQIHLKLSFYQIILIAISFIFAMDILYFRHENIIIKWKLWVYFNLYNSRINHLSILQKSNHCNGH